MYNVIYVINSKDPIFLKINSIKDTQKKMN